MKTKNTEKLVLLAVSVLMASGAGCSSTQHPGSGGTLASNSVGPAGTTTTGTTTTGTTTTGGTAAPAFATSSSVPNADNIFARIQNALTLPPSTPGGTPNAPLVTATSTNTAAALLQQNPNLSSTSNPNTASGAGAVPILSFAACNDVTPASYGVTAGGTLSAQTTNLVNAGVTIVNQCTAGLAASGTTLNTQVASIFSTLVASDGAASPAATTTEAFISVCTAATAFCVSGLSF